MYQLVLLFNQLPVAPTAESSDATLDTIAPTVCEQLTCKVGSNRTCVSYRFIKGAYVAASVVCEGNLKNVYNWP